MPRKVMKADKALIEKANDAYYNEDDPIMTDEEYDSLVTEIPDYVPGDLKEGFVRVKHPQPLLSLDKIHADDTKLKEKLLDILSKYENICIQPKIDGLTIAAYTKEGTTSYVTRGNGAVGELLPNFNNFGAIKQNVLSVRGEAYITKTHFEEIIKDQILRKEQPFKNPRNAAAGILRNKEKSRYLKYISYMVYEVLGTQVSVKEQLEILKQTPFTVVPTFELIDNSVQGLQYLIQVIWRRCLETDIPVDGLVLKPYTKRNTLSLWGTTGHHPNNAIAWKQASDIFEIPIRDITWQVGRFKLTPVAEIEPTEMNGTTVSRATLHNLKFVKDLKLAPGDIIKVCKSGEIIPKVLGIAERGTEEPFVQPDICPCCGKPLRETEIDLCCTNEECEERLAQQISFLASRPVLDIRGLSYSTAIKMAKHIEGNEQKELAIFSFTKKDILSLQGFADKSAEKLYANIQKALKTPQTIGTIFKACCVQGIGSDVGDALEVKFKTPEAIRRALDYPFILKSVKNIGPATIDILTTKSFKERLDKVLSIFTIANKETNNNSSNNDLGKLAGTVWCITGRHPVPRDVLAKKISEHGGKITSSVSSNTSYLLIAKEDSQSTKTQKAKALGIQLVTYSEFLEMIEEE